jgi:glycosyltransferase involved in cell wall biosynthesis
VRNEAASLPRLLESLSGQTFPPSEIVVVDGGSSDGSAEIVKAFAARDSRVRLIEAGPATPGHGRNVGITAARHEWIALTDAGAWPEASWLRHLIDALERQPQASIVYGNHEPVTDSFFCRCAALAYVSPKRQTAEGDLRSPSIASTLLSRDAWRRVGGFPDLRAGEDLIFMQRIASSGIGVAYAPGAIVWWQLQPTAAGTFRRFVLYSRHNVQAGLQKHWHHGLARHYALAAVMVALAVLHDWRWSLVLPSALIARTARLIWRHRASLQGMSLANPVQFLGVMAVILTVDVATFVGWAQALVRRPAAMKTE